MSCYSFFFNTLSLENGHMIKGKQLTAHIQNLVYTCFIEQEREVFCLPHNIVNNSNNGSTSREWVEEVAKAAAAATTSSDGFSFLKKLKMRRKLLTPTNSTSSPNSSNTPAQVQSTTTISEQAPALIRNDIPASATTSSFSIKSPVFLKLTYIVHALKIKYKLAIQYNRKRFAAAIIFYGSYSTPNITVLVFAKKSKIVCTGAKSMEQAKFIILDFLDKLKSIGYSRIIASRLICQNMVSSTYIGYNIDLEKIEETYPEYVTLDEEQFPGAFINPPGLNVKVVAFGSGKAVLTGAKNEQDIIKALDFCPDFFAPFDISKSTKKQQTFISPLGQPGSQQQALPSSSSASSVSSSRRRARGIMNEDDNDDFSWYLNIYEMNDAIRNNQSNKVSKWDRLLSQISKRVSNMNLQSTESIPITTNDNRKRSHESNDNILDTFITKAIDVNEEYEDDEDDIEHISNADDGDDDDDDQELEDLIKYIEESGDLLKEKRMPSLIQNMPTLGKAIRVQ